MLRHRFLQKGLLGGIVPLLLSGMLITQATPANALDTDLRQIQQSRRTAPSSQVPGMDLCRGSGYAKGHERRQAGISRVSQCLH